MAHVDRGAGRGQREARARWRCFPRIAAKGWLADESIVRLKLAQLRLRAAAAMGRVLAGVEAVAAAGAR